MCGKEFGKKTCKKIMAVVTIIAVVMSGNSLYFSNIVKEETEVVQVEAATEVNILDYESNTTATNFVVNDVAGMEKIMELANRSIDLTGKTITLTKDLVYDKKVENNHLLIKDEKYFNGIFDGNNHTISGINIKRADQNFAGLFSQAGASSVIKNLTITDSVIQADYYNIIEETETEDGKTWKYKTAYGVATGGIAGMTDGKIEYCNITSSVQIKGAVAGGIVARADYQFTEISHCRNAGTVEGIVCSKNTTILNDEKISHFPFLGSAGGIIGEGYEGEISYCCNYGAVSGFQAGGILSVGVGTKIRNCCNMGNIKGSGTLYLDGEEEYSVIGGIGGIVQRIENCYNLGRISAGGITKTLSDDNKTVYYSSLVGGLDGNSRWAEQKCINSYNAGIVSGSNSGAITTICYKAGSLDIPSLKKCYYLEGINSVAVNTKLVTNKEDLNTLNLSSVSKSPLGTMLSLAFATELNGNAKAFGATSDVWEADTKGINKGFPILKDVPYDTSITLAMDTDLDTSGEIAKSAHIYSDYSYTNTVSGSVIRVYANGAKVKTDGITTNYKTCTLFTDITPSYIHTLNKNGTVKSSAGKVIVGITLSNSKPTLVKGKIVDKEAANIAKATIRNGQITITAGKQSGVVYLWVMDTGSVGAYESYPINVKGAPATLDLYQVDTNSSGFVYGTTKKYMKENVKVGESIKVYLYPYSKINGQAVKATSGGYTATVDKKATDYIAVEQDSDNPHCYVIYAKSLKAGKKVSGRVTFQCIQSGKKFPLQQM